jgi:2',3'-cyclic-nucleotide 2'-phosphodiesterase (5'-nucleotidase family)
VEDASGKVTSHSGRLIACDDSVPLDPTIQGTLELVREEAERLLDKDLANIPVELPHFTGQLSPFATRVADVLRSVCAADLAIVFSGHVRRGLAAGRLTRRDLYQALRGLVHVTTASISGAQVRRLLESMLDSKYRTESANLHRREPPLGLPAVSSNVSLEYDLSSNQVTKCLIDGQPLEPGRRYRLASTYYTLNDRRGDPEYDFIGLEAGQAVEMVQVEKVLWEIVEGYVKENGGL